MRQTRRGTASVLTTERAAFYRRTLVSPASDSTVRRNAPNTSAGSRDPVTGRAICTDKDRRVAKHIPRLVRLTAKEGA